MITGERGARPEQSAPARLADPTLPQLLVARAEEQPDAVAVQRKRYGIWQSTSWRDLAAQVEAVAWGLDRAGVGPGDVVAILSDNRPEWLVVELAAQSLQAAVVGPHPECSPQELAVLLVPAGVRVVVAEDQQQLDKLVKIPSLALTVCLDPRGGGGRDTSGPVALHDLEEGGRRAAAASPGWWHERVSRGQPQDVAVRCMPTDAGATPEELTRPRSVGVTHHNRSAAWTALTTLDPVSSDIRYVSFLPLGWPWEQLAGVMGWLGTGFALSFPESPATQRSDLRDIGPDVMLAPARLWESMAAEVQGALQDAGRLRQSAYSWARGVGARRASVVGRGKGARASWHAADLLALRAVRDRLGMTRLDRAYSFGGPLHEDAHAFFRSIGVNLKQLYGTVDAGGPVATAADADVRPGTVGSALPGIELRLAADGQILVRSEAVPARPASSVLDQDGWLHTGDKGRLEGDQLVVIDRLGDLLGPDGGEVSPSQVESGLRASPYIEDAAVFAAGGTSAGLGALVVIDPQAVGNWAERRRLPASTYAALSRLAEVGELVAAELARLSASTPAGAPVDHCVLLPRRLDPERGEVTHTLSVRRRVVAANFPAELAELHDLLAGRGPVDRQPSR